MSVNSLKFNTQSETKESHRFVTTYCSCSECNLGLCFELRKDKSSSSCTCSECKHPNNCVKLKKEGTDKKLYSKNNNEGTIKDDVHQVERELFHVITKQANSLVGNRDNTTNLNDTPLTNNNPQDNETSLINDIKQLGKELCHVLTEAANLSLGNSQYTTNISKDISVTENKPNSAKGNDDLIIDTINQIQKELRVVITEANSSTENRNNTTNISKDISHTKNKPNSAKVNEDLIIDKINQLEKELCVVITEANSSTENRNNTTNSSKDISPKKNKPNSAKVNEDLIIDTINQLENELRVVITEANSSTENRNNTTNISKDISLTKNKPYTTKVYEDSIDNKINELEKELCYVITEANSSTENRNNATNISKDISLTKNKPYSTKHYENSIDNKINELEKELCYVITEEPNSSTVDRNNATNISKDISHTKSKLRSKKVMEEMIKNKINQLEKELCLVINEETTSSTNNPKNTTNLCKDISHTKSKHYSARAIQDSIKNKINQIEKELCQIITQEDNLSNDDRKHMPNSSKDISRTRDTTNFKNSNEEPINNEKNKVEKGLCHVRTKTSHSSIDNREYTKYSSKDISITKDKTAWNIKDKTFKKSSTRQHIHSVAINYKPKENLTVPKTKHICKENCLPKTNQSPKEHPLDKSTAELSAQVMNLPYQDFKDSVSIENSQTNLNQSIKQSSFSFNDIVKPDFLTKLKEIYNACSCKVCECITGNFLSTNNDICKCKPCECDECINYANNVKHDKKQAPHSGCPCVSCDRKDCRGVVKNNLEEANCDCRPCDCVKCWDFPSKPCNCEPCQCTECSALGASLLRTVIVAPVQGNFQQNMCQCEPCECVNCTHNYTAMSTNLRRQMSTEIISHANCHCDSCSNDACQLNSEVCRCDMLSKLTKKPNETASRDYDIHRATINCKEGKGQFNSHDTIVTYAFSNNDYSNIISYSKSNCDDCQCLNCECIVCKDKYKILNKYTTPYPDSSNACKCSPCECQICSKTNKQKNTKVKHFGCNKCDCFDSLSLIYGTNDSNNMIAANNSSCKTRYPIKKGKFLTPSYFDAYVTSETKIRSCISNNKLNKEPKNTSRINVSSNDSFCRKVSQNKNITICHTESRYNNMESICEKKIRFDVSEFPTKNVSSNDCSQNTESKQTFKNCMDEKEKGSILSKNSADLTHNKLCEIFKASQKKPIRDIELLEKYIYLSNMLSKTDVALNKSTINSSNVSRQILIRDSDKIELLDEKRVPCIFQNTSTQLIHTISSSVKSTEDIHLNEKQNSKTLHRHSSNCILICDKKSTSVKIESQDYENQLHDINSENNNNVCNSKFEDSTSCILLCDKKSTSVKIESQDYETQLHRINSENNNNDYKCKFEDLATCNDNTSSSTFRANSKEIVDLKNCTVKKGFKVEEKRRLTAKSMTKLSKYNTCTWFKRCKSKKYNKMYKRVTKRKVNEKTITQTDQTNIESEGNVIFECAKKEMLPTNLIYKINSKKYLGLQNKVSPASSINKLLTSGNILCNKMDTELQENNANDNNKAWSIIRKNLYLSCTEVTKSKGVCTIPAMEFDIKTNFKSISIQTPECVNVHKIERNSGKQALTRLLMEVNNLLNSPLLEASQPKIKSADIKEEPTFLPKSELDRNFKTIHVDAASQIHSKCSPIEKETYCNLIRSMEVLQENITNLIDTVLSNAVYKSELLTTKLHLEQKLPEHIPKINSVKSSCHGFKATFVGLRTISDHTVMVKWRLPRQVIFVEGYELQVDGRPVQKIFSPTRCMAILTCLPHSDKLLLTIRTLITSKLPFDHPPAATIIYRPRVK